MSGCEGNRNKTPLNRAPRISCLLQQAGRHLENVRAAHRTLIDVMGLVLGVGTGSSCETAEVLTTRRGVVLEASTYSTRAAIFGNMVKSS